MNTASCFHITPTCIPLTQSDWLTTDYFVGYCWRVVHSCILKTRLRRPSGYTKVEITDNYWYVQQYVERNGSGVELRTLDYESCAAVLIPWASVFTIHCSSSLSYINEYLAIDSGGYVYKPSSCINYSIWLDASQRGRDGVWANWSVREVKCKSLWTVLRTAYWAI